MMEEIANTQLNEPRSNQPATNGAHSTHAHSLCFESLECARCSVA